MHRWRDRVLLVAALLGLLAISTRFVVAAVHHHNPGEQEWAEVSGHHGCPHHHHEPVDEEAPAEEPDCPICEAVAGGAVAPSLPDAVALPVALGFIEPLGEARGAETFAILAFFARGPPSLA